MSNQPTVEVHPAADAVDPAIAESAGEPVTEQLVEETLVEEVSIDGMCGVY